MSLCRFGFALCIVFLIYLRRAVACMRDIDALKEECFEELAGGLLLHDKKVKAGLLLYYILQCSVSVSVAIYYHHLLLPASGGERHFCVIAMPNIYVHAMLLKSLSWNHFMCVALLMSEIDSRPKPD